MSLRVLLPTLLLEKIMKKAGVPFSLHLAVSSLVVVEKASPILSMIQWLLVQR
jgi:hypothetical protein